MDILKQTEKNFLQFSQIHKKLQFLQQAVSTLKNTIDKFKKFPLSKYASDSDKYNINTNIDSDQKKLSRLFPFIGSLNLTSIENLKKFLQTVDLNTKSTNKINQNFHINFNETYSGLEQLNIQYSQAQNDFQKLFEEFLNYCIKLQNKFNGTVTQNLNDVLVSEISIKDFIQDANFKKQRFNQILKTIQKQLDLRLSDVRNILVKFASQFEEQLLGIHTNFQPVFNFIEQHSIPKINKEILSNIMHIDFKASKLFEQSSHFFMQDELDFAEITKNSMSSLSLLDKSNITQSILVKNKNLLYNVLETKHSLKEKCIFLTEIIKNLIALTKDRSSCLQHLEKKFEKNKQTLNSFFESLYIKNIQSIVENDAQNSCFSNSQNVTCSFFVSLIQTINTLSGQFLNQNCDFDKNSIGSMLKQRVDLTQDWIRQEGYFCDTLNAIKKMVSNQLVPGTNLKIDQNMEQKFGEYLEELLTYVELIEYHRQKNYDKLSTCILNFFEQLQKFVNDALNLMKYNNSIRSVNSFMKNFRTFVNFFYCKNLKLS